MDLLTLQNLIKRDPDGYVQEFEQQYRHFQSNVQIFKLQDSNSVSSKKNLKDFAGLLTFLSHVAPSFQKKKKEITKEFAKELLNLIQNHYQAIDSMLRTAIVQALILLQNRNCISRMELLPTFFRLFRCQDKLLRVLLFTHIVSDIRRVNRKKKNEKLNRALQNFMFTMLKDENRQAAKKSLDIVIELWRRQIWTGDKVVNSVMEVCFSPDTKIKVAALRFFLGCDPLDDDDDDGDDPEGTLKDLQTTQTHAFKKKKREREIARAAAKVKKKKNKTHVNINVDTTALRLVYDPQQSAERLFSMLKGSSDSFDVRLLIMNVISRLIGMHKLILENYYPFLQKYIQPHQRHVTQILTFFAQASHELVPPETLIPVIKTLANQFVSDRSSSEVMQVGLNAIREVCSRAPLVMERDLLHDLAMYRKSKAKGVMMAARSLIALYREVNPQLLAKRERGKNASVAIAAKDPKAVPLEFGEEKVYSDFVGADLLKLADEKAEELDELGAADDSDMEGDYQELLARQEEEEEESKNIVEEESDYDDNTPLCPADEMLLKQIKAAEEEVEDNEENNDDEEEDNDDEENKENVKEVKEGKDTDTGMEGEDENDEEMESSSSSSLKIGSEEKGDVKEESQEEKKSLPLGATRILTQEDFERIEKLKKLQELQASNQSSRRGKKRHREDGQKIIEQMKAVMQGEAIDEDNIIGYKKNDKKSKADRLEKILEGREGRGKFGRPKGKGGGTTNKEKIKHKPFTLAKFSSKVNKKLGAKMQDKNRKRGEHIQYIKKQASGTRKTKKPKKK